MTNNKAPLKRRGTPMLILHINYSALIVPGRFHGLAPLLDIS